ncbi:DUF1772 domain-containing protein [Trichoderma novae-zelandiae]
MYLSGPSLVLVAAGIIGFAWPSGKSQLFESRAPRLQREILISLPLYCCYMSYLTFSIAGPPAGSRCLCLSIVPSTLPVINDVNRSLLEGVGREASEETQLSKMRVKGLLDRWNTLNLVRGFLPLAKTALGCFDFYHNGF